MTDRPPPAEAAEPLAETDLGAEEVRRRALGGSGVVVLRGLAINALGFGGSLVLARLLTPKDFGLVALGSSLLLLANFISAGGLGGALIRRPEPPTRLELEALLGLQLGATVVLAGAAAAIAAPAFGRSGQVVAIMMLSLPLLVLRAPGSILLERRLDFKPMVAVEVSENVVFYAFAVAAAALGFGVWGFAAAYVVRSAVGSGVILRLVPEAAVRPRLSIKAVRGLLGFGLQYEAPGVVNIAYMQAVNAAAIAIAGVSTLGIWTLAKAAMSPLGLIFDSLNRVIFPAMSRLAQAGENVAAIMERTIARLSVITGILYVGAVGVLPPLLPVLFGPRWKAAADVVPGVAVGALIGAPISVACAGYLYSKGDAASVLRSAIATCVADLLTCVLLLRPLGVMAFGLARVTGSVADILVLGRAAARSSEARIFRPQLASAGLALVAGTAAWLAAASVGPGVPAAVAGLAAGESLLLGGLWLWKRDLALDTFSVVRRAAAHSIARSDPVPNPQPA